MSNETPSPRAIVVLSGGMDSAAVLGYAVDVWGKENVIALSFDYGQRHKKELFAAENLASHYGVKHIIHEMDMTQIGGSALTDKAIDVPEFKEDENVWQQTHVALSYVPMRNTIFLAIAAAYAEVQKCQYIYVGFNWIDSGGYPDCRPEFVTAMNKLLEVSSRDKPTVSAPLIDMTKKGIVLFGQKYNAPWELTWSCYEGAELPCMKCNACIQRQKGFKEAGIMDPVAVGAFKKELEDAVQKPKPTEGFPT